MFTKRLRHVAIAGIAAATMMGASACGSSSSSASAGGSGGAIADQIKIEAVHDLTGPVAYAGVGADKGAKLAVQEINSSHFLGEGVTVSMDTMDTAGEIDRATSAMTKAMSNSSVNAILGPTMGQQAAAVAPMVNRQKVPTVFTQAGSDGVVTGPYTFRATAPMESYYDIALKWLKDHGAKNIAVVYNATFPTFSGLGEKTVPAGAKKLGMTISQSLKAQSTTQDFTNQAQQIASGKPDAVVMLLTAPQSVTFLSQLRQAGYHGQVAACSVQAAGNVAQAGKAADGLVYPVDYSTAMTDQKSQEFAKAFEKKFGKAPDAYAAEGYDAIWWIARGIKASGDSSREGIQKGLALVAKKGFHGAMGQLSFQGNDMRVPGVMVQWNGGKETLAK